MQSLESAECQKQEGTGLMGLHVLDRTTSIENFEFCVIKTETGIQKPQGPLEKFDPIFESWSAHM